MNETNKFNFQISGTFSEVFIKFSRCAKFHQGVKSTKLGLVGLGGNTLSYILCPWDPLQCRYTDP